MPAVMGMQLWAWVSQNKVSFAPSICSALACLQSGSSCGISCPTP